MFTRTFLILLLWLSLLTSTSVLAGDHAIIVSSSNSSPYLKTIKAYQTLMQKNFSNISLEIYDLSKEQRLLPIKKNYSFGLALGQNAVLWFNQHMPELSVVAALIKDKKILQNYPNITGIDLQYEPAQQLHILRQLLPEYSRYGLLYSPTRESEIETLKKLAAQYQIKLITQRVDEPQLILESIKKLLREVDLIWGVSDPTIMVPQTAKTLLLATYREKIPLISPSVGWVKVGALLGNDWSYSDIANQCFIFTEALLQGKKVAELIPVSLNNYRFSVNSKTMKWLMLNKLSQQRLTKEAIKVYE